MCLCIRDIYDIYPHNDVLLLAAFAYVNSPTLFRAEGKNEGLVVGTKRREMRKRYRGWVHYGFSRVDTPPVEFRGGRQHGVAMEAPTTGGMVTPIATYEGNIYP